MSYQAVTWALKQPIQHSPAKFVLVALAHFHQVVERNADEPMRAWASTTTLAQATGQDRKTVLANIQRLLAMGYLIDTGEREGQTKSVVIYVLAEPQSSTEIGTTKQTRKPSKAVPKLEPLSSPNFSHEAIPKPEQLSDTETGTASAGEAVPIFPTSSPNFPGKQSQFSPEAVPISPTEEAYEKEGKGIGKGKATGAPAQGSAPARTRMKPPVPDRFELAAMDLPDWLPRETWEDWVDHRIAVKAPMTARAANLAIRHLDRLRQAGNDPVGVVEQSVRSGKWTDLYPLKDQLQGKAAPMRMSRQEQAEAEHQRFLELTGGAHGDGRAFDAGGF